jgi:transcriptional regulator with XRE-family HTH domain
MRKPAKSPQIPDPTIRCQELGDELRQLRAAQRLALREVAHITCLDPSNLARIENGHRPPNRLHLESLLTAYRADRPTRRRLESLAEQADETGWWQRDRDEPTERQRTLVSQEAKAERIVSFEPIVVPGLLQTGEYTRSLMAGSGMVPEDKIEDGMAARFCRQSVLDQWDAPTLLAIIDELALHRVVGCPAVMQRQFAHLVDCSRRKRITIQVVPNGSVHAGVEGAFELIKQPDRPPIVHFEHAASVLFIEKRSEVEVYERIISTLLDNALSESQSVECIASMAKRFDVEGTG